MTDRVHTKLAKDERFFLGQILQAQQIFFELALIVQINVEAKKVDILRQEIFGRRISRVRKENVRIDCTTDSNQMFDKLGYAAHPEPAHHRTGDFISNQITEDRRMTAMFAHRLVHRTRNLVARFFLSQKLDMLRPRQRDEHTHPGRRATIEKPARRRVINTDEVEPSLAHEREIDVDLLRPPEMISLRVRLDWPGGHAFNKKFLLA